MVKILYNQKGFSLITAALVVSLLAGSMTYLGISLSTLNRNTIRQKNYYEVDLILNSLVDYTILGVKNRWCFTNTWDKNPNCLTPTSLTDPFNSERLLLSPKAIDTLESLGVGSVDVALTNITHTLPMNNFGSGHPIKMLVDNLQDQALKDQDIKIEIIRLENNNLYSKSGEIYLQVRATALGSVSGLGTAKGQSVEASLVVFPQELGGYALVVADDLKIGYTDAPGKGQGLLPEAPADPDKGIRFLSPVYVNGAIDLQSLDTNKSAVAFLGPVVMGGDYLKVNGAPFVPKVSTGLSRYSDIASVNGFYGGLTFLDERDPGLDRLAGIKPDQSNTVEKVSYCVRRNLARWDLSYTKDSDLYVRRGNPKDPVNHPDDIVFGLALSRWNRFLPQKYHRAHVEKVEKDPQGGEYYSSSVVKGVVANSDENKDRAWFNDEYYTDDPIMRVTVEMESIPNPGESSTQKWTVVSELATDSYIDIKPKVLDKDKIKDLAAQPNPAVEAKKNEQIDINRLEAEISQLQSDISAKEDELTALQAAGGTATAISALQTVIAGLRNELDGKNLELAGRSSSGVQQEIDNLEGQNNFAELLARAEEAEKNPPVLRIKTEPVLRFGNVPEFNQHRLVVEPERSELMPMTVKITIEPYDVGYFYSRNQRVMTDHVWKKGHSRTGVIQLGYSGGKFVAEPITPRPSSGWALADPSNRGKETDMNIPLTEPFVQLYGADGKTPIYFGQIEDECGDNKDKKGRAFAATDWNTSFTPYTRKAWDFAHPSSAVETPPPPALSLDATSSAGSNIDFLVRSIVNQCNVTADAELVAGFFNCDVFRIEARSTPLKIIGTVITSKLIVHPSAITNGIMWSNIYHPEGVNELRKAGVLKPYSGTGDCNSLNINGERPIWHPHPSMEDLANTYACSPYSLRNLANPFTWSTVDPDCGIISPNFTQVQCKHRTTRFIVKEVGRASQ